MLQNKSRHGPQQLQPKTWNTAVILLLWFFTDCRRTSI